MTPRSDLSALPHFHVETRHLLSAISAARDDLGLVDFRVELRCETFYGNGGERVYGLVSPERPKVAVVEDSMFAPFTVIHELRHVWQLASGRAPDEDDAERYARAMMVRLTRERVPWVMEWWPLARDEMRLARRRQAGA